LQIVGNNLTIFSQLAIRVIINISRRLKGRNKHALGKDIDLKQVAVGFILLITVMCMVIGIIVLSAIPMI